MCVCVRVHACLDHFENLSVTPKKLDVSNES